MSEINDYPFPNIKQQQEDEIFIPPVPETYCFVGENFLSETFSVDGFVRRNSKRVNSLEKLKEHLAAYLKILKQSMVNLINQDYTEFINLSANLVSFDKSINNIKTSVLKLKNETNNTKFKIEEIIVSMNAKQERLKAIRESKQKLNMILDIIEYLDRIETNIEWIDSKLEICYDVSMKKSIIYSSLSESSTLIARLNLNFNFLLGKNPETQKNDNKQFLFKLKQRFDVACKKFYEIIKNEILFLLNCDQIELRDEVHLNDIIQLIEQLFVMYLIDGNKKELENIIKNNIKSHFEEIICGNQMSKNELKNMFPLIIKFIDEKCFLLIKVLNTSKVLSSYKFELIISIIWDTFVELFLVRTLFLLDISDSETFQENYFFTFKFIEEFLNKTCLLDYRSQFEQHESYIQLKSKFKLNVYFHMKLKKISTNLENSFDKFSYSFIESNDSIFKLTVTETVHVNLMDCWRNSAQNFYIGDLFIYLWKLTLKILARFSTWIVNIDLESLNSYLKTKNTNETNLKRLIHQTLCALITDSYLIMNKFIELFNTVIKQHWNSYFNTKLAPKLSKDNKHQIEHSSLRSSFDEVVKNFESTAIGKTIFIMKTEITEECKCLLNLVNDIPRLYRRTNKEKPREASNYVYKCIDQLVECINMISFGSNNKSSDQWLKDILIDIAQHYKHLTLEVLTSVQKTEDSLKKLKKLKVNPIQSTNTSMSDDDKIRLQIYYDVKSFGDELQNKLGIDLKSIKPYYELLETIDSLKILQ